MTLFHRPLAGPLHGDYITTESGMRSRCRSGSLLRIGGELFLKPCDGLLRRLQYILTGCLHLVELNAESFGIRAEVLDVGGVKGHGMRLDNT